MNQAKPFCRISNKQQGMKAGGHLREQFRENIRGQLRGKVTISKMGHAPHTGARYDRGPEPDYITPHGLKERRPPDLYYEAKKETLIMLYRHTLLTAEQLAISLNYKPKTIYNISCELKEKGLIRTIPLPFLKRNHVGYTLTAFGARAGASLAGDETVFRAKAWEAGPVQIEHFFGTNAFITDVIRHSISHAEEGMLEWLDPRSAAERYVQSKKTGKAAAPVKPDGFGMYLFPDRGRLAFHLEYDTGTETLWRLKDKLFHYGTLLPTIWPKVEAVQVLFVTKIESRPKTIIDIWEALMKGTFKNDRLPSVWAISEKDWKQKGVGGTLWLGSGGQRLRLKDMQLLPTLADPLDPLLGKQPRELPPKTRR
ncbi:replication-relaxation family protein [Cohnella sp.]|uniref:replication-relaxation family protein n=1 Tax=Cohnella sp. TaxID=1883426 RepID=UPI003561D1B9